MTRLPPIPAVLAMIVAVSAAACGDHRPDPPGPELIVASGGILRSIGRDGTLADEPGAPSAVRFVSAAAGVIAVTTADDALFVSASPSGGGSRAWRELPIGAPGPGRPPAGIDVPGDGGRVAIVRGDPGTPALDLVTVDVASGKADVVGVPLAANGGPSWADGRLILQVIGRDQHSGIAIVDPLTGAVTASAARGFEPSFSADGRRVALIDADGGGLRVGDADAWLAGGEALEPGPGTPDGGQIGDVALAADGTWLAVVLDGEPDTTDTVVAFALLDGTWTEETSLVLPRGESAASIDWLEGRQ